MTTEIMNDKIFFQLAIVRNDRSRQCLFVIICCKHVLDKLYDIGETMGD